MAFSRHPDDRERGCWKLPAVLEELGLHTATGAHAVTRLSQPAYPKKYTYNDGTLFGDQIAVCCWEAPWRWRERGITDWFIWMCIQMIVIKEIEILPSIIEEAKKEGITCFSAERSRMFLKSC
ncbi:hypothetical protein [Paenibacillus sp. NPDC055715]